MNYCITLLPDHCSVRRPEYHGIAIIAVYASQDMTIHILRSTLMND